MWVRVSSRFIGHSETVLSQEEPTRYVYFPEDAVVSLLAVVERPSAIEVGMVGREGIVGIAAFLGAPTARTDAIVQVAGRATRMQIAALRRECAKAGKLPQLLHRYTAALLTQMALTAACNRFHNSESRLTRWLLLMRDRTRSDEFFLTQDFLSLMLGLRREGVNKASGVLQNENLLRYSRGNLVILDRSGLKKRACSCYREMKREYDSFVSLLRPA